MAEHEQEPTRINDKRRVGRSPEELERLTRIAAEEAAKARGEESQLSEEQENLLGEQLRRLAETEKEEAEQQRDPDFLTVLMVQVRLDGSIQVVSDPQQMVGFLTSEVMIWRPATQADWISIAAQLQMLASNNAAVGQMLNGLMQQAMRAQAAAQVPAIHPVTGQVMQR